MSLGEAQVPVRLTLDKLDRDLNQARGKIDGALGKIGGGLQSLGKAALVGIATGVAAVGGAMAVAGKHAIQLGADAGETASLLETSLGPAAAGLNSELREFATNANRSFFELQEGSATFVAMTKSMGATEQQAADLGVGFTTAATDLGSFFNVPAEQSLMDIQGALAGSSETLQKYGIDVRETTLKQMALDQGLISTASETIPRLDRAMLIQQAITEQAADAMGDAERTSDSWQNVMRGLQGRLKDTATEIGMKLIPALEPLLGKFLDLTDNVLAKLLPILEDVIEVFGQFIENIIGGSEPLSALTGLIWNLLGAFGVGEETATSITETFFTLADGARTLWNRITALLAPIIEAIGSFVSWKDVLIGLGVAIASVVIPIIISIAGAVAPVIAAFVLVTAAVALLRNAWENNWGDIQGKVKAVIAFIVPLVTNAIGNIKTFWAENGEAILSKARQVWETVQSAISTVLNVVWSVIQNVVSSIQSFWAANGDAILAKAREIWQTIQLVVTTVINTVKAILETVTAAILTAWETHGEDIKASAERFWNAIKGFVESVINTISDIITAVSEGIAAFWSEHGEGIRATAETVWGKIKEIIDTSMASISTLFDTFAALFEGDWEGFLDGIKELWQASWDNIESAFEAAKEVLMEIAGIIVDEIKEALEPTIESLQGKFETVMGAIEGAISPVSEVWTGFVDAIKGFWNWLKGKVFNFSINLPDVPSWALPGGSPTPLQRAWEDMERSLNSMRIQPQIDLGRMSVRPQFDLDRMLPVTAPADVGQPLDRTVDSRTYQTTVNTNRDPMRVLRASRHLDKLGRL